MKKRDVEHWLKQEGFTWKRETKVGAIWEDNLGQTVLVNRSFGNEVRNDRNCIAAIERVLRARPKPPGENQTLRAPLIAEALVQKKVEEFMHMIATPGTTQTMIATQKPKTKIRRFKAEDRFTVWERIRDLADNSLTPVQIHAQMKKENFTMGGSTDPIELKYIVTVLRNLGPDYQVRGSYTKPASAPPTVALPEPLPAPVKRSHGHPDASSGQSGALPPSASPGQGKTALPDAIVWILTDEFLDALQKIQMIRAWAKV